MRHRCFRVGPVKVKVTPATLGALPSFERTVRKDRPRLSDDEIAIYLQRVHPLECRRHPVHKRQTMGAISRQR